jgi:hypothetical protein
MKIQDIQNSVKATSSERQVAARKELAELWAHIRAAFAAGELAAIRPEVLKECANGTGYLDGALSLVVPQGKLYGGRDAWGRHVLVFQYDNRTQCIFERHSDDEGNVLISQRDTLVNEYAAEKMLLILRQAVEGLFQQEEAVAMATSGDGYFDLQFKEHKYTRKVA